MPERDAAVQAAACKMLVATGELFSQGGPFQTRLADDVIAFMNEPNAPREAWSVAETFALIRAARDELRAALDTLKPTGGEP